MVSSNALLRAGCQTSLVNLNNGQMFSLCLPSPMRGRCLRPVEDGKGARGEMVAGSSGAGQADTDFFLKKSFVFIPAFVAFNKLLTTEQNPFNYSTIQLFTYSVTASSKAESAIRQKPDLRFVGGRIADSFCKGLTEIPFKSLWYYCQKNCILFTNR